MRMPITNGLQFLRWCAPSPSRRCPGRHRHRRLLSGDPIQHELKSLGASIRFKPLWLEDLIALGEDARSPVTGVNDRFLRACRREPVDATPVWFMRQAGRYMPEYRALRERYLAARDLPPAGARRRGDAAAGRRHRRRRRDSLLRSAAALHADGARLRLRQGRRAGDRESDPRRRPTSIACACSSRAKRSGTCSRRSACCAASSTDRVPLIGFGGAPFTLAAYAIEGGPSTNYATTKAFMYAQPQAWHRLCDALRRRRSPTTCGRRSRPARRRCRSSTRGPAR